MFIEILFDIHVLFPCNCILLQRCYLFCYQNKLTRSQRSLFPFFIVKVLFCIIYFHLSQLMTVYSFEHTKGLKQFMNMYTISLTVKHYFYNILRLESANSIDEISRVPEYLTLSRKSSHHWVILNARQSTV